MNAPMKLICTVLALVLFFIAAFLGFVVPATEPYHGRLVAAGLFFWVLSTIVS